MTQNLESLILDLVETNDPDPTNVDPTNGVEAGDPKTSSTTVSVSYEDFDYDKLMVYAGVDCIATSGLLGKIFPNLVEEVPIQDVDLDCNVTPGKAPAILESYLKLEVPAHEFLIDLEINGMGYSVGRNEWIAKKMVVELAEMEEKIFSGIGHRVDLNSGPAVAEFLYNEKGFTPPYQTKGGEPATDGMAIMTLAGLDPLGNKYITADPSLQYLADMAKRRDINSVYNTFIKNYVKDFVKERTGRIHPSYNQFGTSSFRISGNSPNTTQLPRAKHGYDVRTCYTTYPDSVFIAVDFSSAEVKLLAWIAQEKEMIRAIAEGLDFHTFSASSMRKIPYEEMASILADQGHPQYKEYKGYRQLAKVLI